MKIYGWVPDSYGEWVYVLAESPEAAKRALEASYRTDKEWDAEYHNARIAEWVMRDPDVTYEVGQPIFGEIA